MILLLQKSVVKLYDYYDCVHCNIGSERGDGGGGERGRQQEVTCVRRWERESCSKPACPGIVMRHVQQTVLSSNSDVHDATSTVSGSISSCLGEQHVFGP